MYEELVEEFEFKKSATNILEIKDSKISNLTLEINKAVRTTTGCLICMSKFYFFYV